jgi:hypothetical protein
MSKRLTAEEVRQLVDAQIKVDPGVVNAIANFWDRLKMCLTDIEEGRVEAFWEEDPFLGNHRIKIRAVTQQ